MAKRLTDTEIWEQDWFVELPTKYKLFWNYIKDKCDHVGIWRPNKVLAQKIIGESIDVQDFLMFINTQEKQRIIILPNGRWFLRDFFIFQYGDHYSPTSLVHKGAIKSLLSNGVHPKDILGERIGDLQELSIQEFKQIAYNKDTKIILKAFGNGIDRAKE